MLSVAWYHSSGKSLADYWSSSRQDHSESGQRWSFQSWNPTGSYLGSLELNRGQFEKVKKSKKSNIRITPRGLLDSSKLTIWFLCTDSNLNVSLWNKLLKIQKEMNMSFKTALRATKKESVCATCLKVAHICKKKKTTRANERITRTKHDSVGNRHFV
jgi:hypothetical protein